jgi:hypothetical protein
MRNQTTKYKATVAAVFSLALLAFIAADAQTLFRCGKTYQDRPCDAGQETKVLTTSRSASPQSTGTSDASCVQRGVDAQKIVWTREGGAILDQQLANARSSDERKLVADVYNRRGTSSEIRAFIEADCVAEKEKAARLAALTGVGGSTPSNAAAESTRLNAASGQGTDKSGSRDQVASNTERKKISCDGLKEELDRVRDAQRTGGDAAAMHALNREKSNAEKRLAQQGC